MTNYTACARRSRRDRVLVNTILSACVLWLVAGNLFAEYTVERPRLASANFGEKPAVVIVGRSGVFGLPGSRGVLQVGEIQSGLLRIVAEMSTAEVICDVDTGSFDGTERDDVFSVGDGLLRVYRYHGNELQVLAFFGLRSEWTDRIATLNDPENGTLVAVTEYEIQPDQDVGVTTIRGFRVRGGELVEVWSFDIGAHVGDLALLSGERPFLVLESGAGDEGGDLSVYDVTGVPDRVWSGRVTEGERCLSVQRMLGASSLLVHPVGGRPQLFTSSSGRLIRARSVDSEGTDILLPVGSSQLMRLKRQGSRWVSRGTVD
ncbi:hypothetical protein MK139_05750 [bacterium]|nr:hypothetical protein [bacterium]